ncbi:MAG: lasso RiPP family leader peptide-containing protein [Acidimicrobiales bacterium]
MERVHGQQRTYEAPKLEVVGSIADVTGGNTFGQNHDLTRCHTVSGG